MILLKKFLTKNYQDRKNEFFGVVTENRRNFVCRSEATLEMEESTLRIRFAGTDYKPP